MRWVLPTLTFSALVGCRDLPHIEADVCGNAVIEAGEDCDTFASPADNPGGVCRPKGVVGECHWDCRVDVNNQRGACQTGWGCAPDGLCHKAVEDAYEARRLSSDLSSWLSAADYDGDGRTDLISTEPADQVQQARFRLHYFNDESELEETRTFPRITTRPVIHHSAEKHDTSLIFSNFRIGMVMGRPDREWVPAAFSPYVVQDTELRVVNLLDELVLGNTVLATFANLDETAGVYVPESDGSGLALKATLRRPIDELVSEPLGAPLFTAADSPCREVVYAFRGEQQVQILDLCQLGSAGGPDITFRDTAVERRVQLPEGVGIDAGPITVDLDGDGNLDLLMGSAGLTYVAYGDGNQLAPAAGPVQLKLIDEDELQNLPMPLAAGDVSGDELPDFVLPTGVLASHRSLVDDSVLYAMSYANNERPWTVAQIADINGNDLLDVVAASAGSPGISLLNGTGSFYQVGGRLSTHGNVRLVTTGDFDGDLIQDVAILENGARQDSPDGIAIAFGARDQLPLSSTRIAEVRGGRQLGHTRDVGLDSLFMSATEQVGGRTQSSLTLWDGSPDRLPLAPYSLVTFSTNMELANTPALSLVAGGFTEPGAGDVVALGTSTVRDGKRDEGYTLWLLRRITETKQPPLRLEFERVPGVDPISVDNFGRARLRLAVFAGDLDGDHLDEVVALMATNGSDCTLVSYAIDAAHDRAERKGLLVLGEPCPEPELGGHDTDGDGDIDVLLLLTGDPSAGPRRLTTLSELTNGFSAEYRRDVDVGGEDVRGFAPLPLRNAIKVAIVTSGGLSIATSSRQAGVFDVVRPVKAFTDARGVAILDPNQDGLDDLVVADAEGLWLVTAELQ